MGEAVYADRFFRWGNDPGNNWRLFLGESEGGYVALEKVYSTECELVAVDIWAYGHRRV